MRLDASAERRQDAVGTHAGYGRACLECGAPLEPSQRNPDFCCNGCRKAWNNRRMARGALIYDLFMAARFERKLATTLKVWRYLARMASGFRAEDQAQRAGRPSWRRPQEIIARHPYLRADRIAVSAKRAKP